MRKLFCHETIIATVAVIFTAVAMWLIFSGAFPRLANSETFVEVSRSEDGRIRRLHIHQRGGGGRINVRWIGDHLYINDVRVCPPLCPLTTD